MSRELSSFGLKFGARTGILELMDDLGNALSGGEEMLMLGGGNPARIPAVQAVWRRRMEEILAEGNLYERVLGNYDPPRGNNEFITALTDCLNRHYDWELTPDNVAVTNGGQTAFFFLLNMLAGAFEDGTQRRVLFPLTPEYIGYADQGLCPDLFVSRRPRIELIGSHEFKYYVDFEGLDIPDDCAALCVSRPTNPTGNVLTDLEIRRLTDVARDRDIPLIIDNAYGAPFPNIVFGDIQPVWNPNIILTLSLSKIGLPGTRTGIVIAEKRITAAVASMSAVIGLANGTIGQAITTPLLESGELLRLGRDVMRPYYEEKSVRAQQWVAEFFDDNLPYRVHKSEGALFLWMWFKDLPITTGVLYERLKARRVLVVPGRYFFYGLDEDWAHRDECIRVTFSQDDHTVREGLRIIAEEVQTAYRS